MRERRAQKALLTTLFLGCMVMTSCQGIKAGVHAARQTHSYELYELATYECGECRKKRLLLELEGSVVISEIKKEVALGVGY